MRLRPFMLTRTNRDIDVVMAYQYIERGTSKVVDDAYDAIIFVHHVEVNGHYFQPEVAKLRADGFLTLEISASDYEPAEYRQRHLDAIDALRSELTPEDWLFDSDDEMLCLPVSSLHWHHLHS